MASPWLYRANKWLQLELEVFSSIISLISALSFRAEIA